MEEGDYINEYIQKDGYTQMKIESPKYGIFLVKIDNDDVPCAKMFRWGISRCWNKKTNKTPRFYVSCNLPNSKSTFMHRMVTNAPKGKIVDHINGDELDNRKSNLRICTQKENIENSKHYINSTSGCKGVCWDRNFNKWIAYIKITDCYHRLGFYNEKEDAIKARKRAELKYFDEYAYDPSLSENYQPLFSEDYTMRKPTCDCLKIYIDKIPQYQIAEIINEDISVPVKYDPNKTGKGYVRYLEYNLNFCPNCGKPMENI